MELCDSCYNRGRMEKMVVSSFRVLSTVGSWLVQAPNVPLFCQKVSLQIVLRLTHKAVENSMFYPKLGGPGKLGPLICLNKESYLFQLSFSTNALSNRSTLPASSESPLHDHAYYLPSASNSSASPPTISGCPTVALVSPSTYRPLSESSPR